MPNAPEILSKTALMQGVIDGILHESFEHSDPEIGVFDITQMRKLSAGACSFGVAERILVELEPIIPFLESSRDFDLARLADLTEDDLNDPGLCILLPSGESILVDGTHRALARFRRGDKVWRLIQWKWDAAHALCRPPAGFGRPPGIDWGNPNFFSDTQPAVRAEGENHGE
jgi:hypothetical protein